jgi:hypothetical protein
MYSAALFMHSWIRWAVILAGLYAFVRAALGTSRRSPWTPADDRAGFWFVTALDLQMVFGLILYFLLSPLTAVALHNFSGAMKDPILRFWGAEHPFGMIIGIALAHVGQVRARKTDSLRRHRVAAIFFGLALVVILASIPWPGSPHGRPLLHW